MSFFKSILIIIIGINAIKCEELVELTCNSQLQCKQFEQANVTSNCADGHCQCNNTLGERVTCKPPNFKQSNIIGGHCPCHQQNAECNTKEEKCYCIEGFMASKDKRRCVPIKAKLGEKCECDSQCEMEDNYAACNSTTTKCTCRHGFAQLHDQCVSIVDCNATCIADFSCENYGSNVTCHNGSGRCICPVGHVKAENRTQCLQAAAYKENCTDNQQCQYHSGLGAICSDNICQCNEKFSYAKVGDKKMKCLPMAEPGQYCRCNDDCHQANLTEAEQTMECIFGECMCKNGYFSIDNTECRQGGASNLKFNFFVLLIILVLSISQ